ncbi:hypothetical protein Tco_0710499 [Tanacetum coccineum]
MNGFRALQTNIAFLLRKDFLSYNSIPEGAFERAFLQIFSVEVSIFKRILSQNLDKLEEQLTKDTFHENDFKIALTALKAPFERLFNFDMQTLSTFGTRMDFKSYTRMKTQIFKNVIICNTNFIEKYILKTILHQQEVQKLLTKKKLLLTQKFKSIPFKHRLLIQSSWKTLALGKKTVLSKEDLKGTHIEHGFKRAFMSLFGQDDEIFTSTMFLNADQLQKQLDKDKFQEDKSMAAFWMISKYFVKYIGIEVKHFKDTLLQHMGNVKKSVAKRTRHQRHYNRRVNKRQMQIQDSKVDLDKALDAGLVVTERSRIESGNLNTRSRSGNDTYAGYAYIRPVYDEEPMAKEQSTAECNIFATRQQHTEQPEFNNRGGIQEKVFAIAALKNELRKLKGNSVDTKFVKTSVLGKPDLQSLRNQSVVRQSNAFESERPQISKPQFASQGDVKNDLSKPITQHYFPERRESALAKLDQVIASSSFRNSSKNMPRFRSNNMVHDHYLEAAKKKT